MKMKLLLLFFCVVTINQLLASRKDTLFRQDGKQLLVSIVEITDLGVLYRGGEKKNNSKQFLKKNELVRAAYYNGISISFTAPIDSYIASHTELEAYEKGMEHSEQYYEHYKAAATGTLVTSIFSPLIGLIPAFSTSLTKPQAYNLDYPSASLMLDADYARGYEKKARVRKQKQIWKNWAIGFGFNVAVTVFALTR